MPSSVTTGSLVYERRIQRVHKYHWPAVQLNLWLLIMLTAACTIMAILCVFIEIQQRLLLPIPWYFPYFITVTALTILYVGLLLALIFQRRLLPSIVMLGAIVLFVLWIIGLIVVAINLWGPVGDVWTNCDLAVFTQSPTGQTIETLAWLEQKSICQSWQALFAFALIGTLFLLWIMVMAYRVFVDDK